MLRYILLQTILFNCLQCVSQHKTTTPNINSIDYRSYLIIGNNRALIVEVSEQEEKKVIPKVSTLVKDTAFIENLGVDSLFWRIIEYKNFEKLEIVNTIDSAFPNVEIVEISNDNFVEGAVLIHKISDSFEVRHYSSFGLDFIGANYLVSLSQDLPLIAHNDSVIFCSSIVDFSSHKLNLINGRFILLTWVNTLLSEHNSATKLNIDKTYFYWAIVLNVH